MTKICVLGATGQTGTAIINQALKNDVEILALVRSPEKMTQNDDKLTVVKAEVSDLGSAEVLDHLKTCDHVIIALGSTKIRGDSIRSDGTKAMLSALKKAEHTPRVWIISSAGTGDSYDQMTLPGKMIVRSFLRWVIQDHHVQEQALLASGLPYTILRPTGLNNQPVTGNYVLAVSEKLQSTQISREEVAHCVVNHLNKDDLLNKAVCITSK